MFQALGQESLKLEDTDSAQAYVAEMTEEDNDNLVMVLWPNKD
jgi:hypothetical protein